MITFFTTTKAFIDKNLVNQINAIKSWIIGNKYGCEAIIFQKEKGIEKINGVPNIRIIEKIRSNENNVPFINAMFYEANLLAKNDILCFLNADIIINDDFIESLLKIHKSLKKKYLVVGQRYDTFFDYFIDFQNPQWYNDLIKKNHDTLKIHPPFGSDYFAFPKNQYPQGSLPDLLVGRNGWDNYMFYETRMKSYKLINLSSQYKVIHQNHNYNHKSENENVKKKEDNHNYDFIHKYEKNFYTLESCNYIFQNNSLKKTFKDWKYRLHKLRRMYFTIKDQIFS